MAETTEKLDISREKILSLLMEEALNGENKGSERVAALSHLGRFTLGELHRNENTDVTFQWMDDDEVADVGASHTDVKE